MAGMRMPSGPMPPPQPGGQSRSPVPSGFSGQEWAGIQNQMQQANRPPGWWQGSPGAWDEFNVWASGRGWSSSPGGFVDAVGRPISGQRAFDAWNKWKQQRAGGIGPVGSRSYRGPTSPWGSSGGMRTGGGASPALMNMLGGGGGEEQLMALLQQLGG